MKSDIETLMSEHHITTLWVNGSGRNNPAMVYLAGGIEVDHADLFVCPGKPPILFHTPIERDGAAQAGFPLRSYAEFHYGELLQEAGGDTSLAVALRYREMFKSMQLETGRMVVYGYNDIGFGHFILTKLHEFFPALEIIYGEQSDVLRQARAVKSPDELARIQKMGAHTVAVVGEIQDFITGHAARNEVLVKNDGSPLTIADVKKRLRLLLAERNLQESGTIFAAGRDAGVPHNVGNPAVPLRLGETIIFDAFFQEAGGGYFYDFTRTWCLGFARDEVLSAYEQLQEVYAKVVDAVCAGNSFHHYHKMTCSLFEAMGHATLQSNPLTENGFVHGLGHGVGLEIHELPTAQADVPESLLREGMVLTIEPGLYYPERGYGMRIEDTYQVGEDGRLDQMVDYPQDLVLQVSEWK